MKGISKSELEEIRLQGLTQRKNNKYAEAIAIFQKILELSPNDQRAHIDIAICYRMSGLFDESAHVLRDFLKKENVSEGLRVSALKNLKLNNIEKVKLLIAESKITMARDLLENIIRENINGEFDADIVHAHFQLMKNTPFAKITAYQLLVYISGENKIVPQNILMSIIDFFIGRGEYKLAREVTEKYVSQESFRSLFYLKILLEMNHISEALIESNKILNQPDLPSYVVKANLLIRYQLGLLSFRMDIANEALNGLISHDRHKTMSGNISTINNIRKNYIYISEKTEVDFKSDTCKYVLSKAYMDSLKKEENHFKQVILSVCYLYKVLSPKGKSLMINDIKANEKLEKRPIKIIQYWNEISPPNDVATCINSWKNEKEFCHELYNYDSVKTFISENYGLDGEEIFDQCDHPAMQSDIFRLFYLYKNGGVYIDADEFCKDVPYFITDQQPSLRIQRVNMLEIPNGFISLPRESIILQIAIEDLLTKKKEINAKNVWWTSGPGLLTKSLAVAYSRSLLGLNDSLNHGLRLVHNSDYNASIYTPSLAYKNDERSWQRAAFAQPTLLL